MSSDSDYVVAFLANVTHVHVRYVIARRPSVCLSSVVCNVRAPYSGDLNFWQCFYAIWYTGHLLTSREKITEIIPGESGELNTRGLAEYSDFGHQTLCLGNGAR